MSAPRDPFLALRNPEFRSFIGVRFFTTFALQMQFTALAWTTYARTDSKLALGALGLCEFLPVILLALPVGHQVEKLEKKRVLLAALGVALLGSTLIAALNLPALHDRLPLQALIGGFFALVALGGIRINRQPTDKAHARLRPGDVLTVPVRGAVRVVKVLALAARRGPPAEAATLFEDMTDPPDPGR